MFSELAPPLHFGQFAEWTAPPAGSSVRPAPITVVVDINLWNIQNSLGEHLGKGYDWTSEVDADQMAEALEKHKGGLGKAVQARPRVESTTRFSQSLIC